jgi:glycerate kinase
MTSLPTPHLKVVVAPDSFKGSMSATDAAAAIAHGWLSARPDDDVTCLPQADGGEGTLDAVVASVPGAERRSAGLVTGPDGRPTPGEWVALPGGTAVVELAQMCGLPLMSKPDPEGATTFGLGEVLRVALDDGATRLVIGLGGSASTDAGSGALAALGLTGDGSLVSGGGSLGSLSVVEQSTLIDLPVGGVLILTDVDAPLAGPRGAAAVFGAQKGADAGQVESLDRAVRHFAALLGGPSDLPGMGAAGGAGYGLATWGGTITSGAGWISSLTNLTAKIADADVVLTGEGRFDETSLGGKLVGETVAACRRAGTTVGVIAGQVAVASGADVWTTSLADLAGSVEGAIADPGRWLREAGARAAHALAT